MSNDEFVEWVKKELAAKGQSMVWLARQLGYAPVWGARVAKGQRRLTIDEMEAIKRALASIDASPGQDRPEFH